ncbi:hypothetical protein OAH15_00360 [bacterium]|nr:hypothetical protein [bacterium]
MFIISKLIANRVKSFFYGDGDCRLIIPGLTEDIAQEIHNEISISGLRSFLAINKHLTPSEEKKWVRPNALTTERSGSFAVVTCPGEISSLQEGVFGPGGVVRDIAYDEDFPFAKNYLIQFDFKELIKEVVEEWRPIDDDEKNWIIDFIIEGIIPSCRSLPAGYRAQFMLEKIISKFNPDDFNSINSLREKFLCHCGVPGIIEKEDAKSDIKDICDIYKDLRDRLKEDARSLAHENISALEGDEEFKKELKSCIDKFLDEIGGRPGDSIAHGILEFSNGWVEFHSRQERINHWRLLDRKLLKELFEVRVRANNTTLRISKLSAGTDGLSSERGIMAYDGETIKALVEYDSATTSELFAGENWQLHLKHRAATIETYDCEAIKGSYEFQIDSAKIQGDKSKTIPIKLELMRNLNVESLERLEIDICSADRPKLAVIHEENWSVFDIADEEQDSQIVDNFNKPASGKICLWEPTDKLPKVLQDDKEIKLKKLDQDLPCRIFDLDQDINPAMFDGENSEFEFTHSNSKLNISFQPTMTRNGEFTLEDELRESIIAGKGLSKLLDIFTGKIKKPFSNLGSITESNFKLREFSKLMTRKDGWKPVIANIFSRATSITENTTLVYCGSDTNKVDWINGELEEKLKNLHSAYIANRYELIKCLESKVDGRLPVHPFYAFAPIYTEDPSREVEKLIVAYLQTYCELLETVQNLLEKDEIRRSDAFTLSAMDRVVHRGIELDNEIFILGPWHPLILSRRFMVQRSLFLSASNKDKGKNYTFGPLARLLESISGVFRGKSQSKESASFDAVLLSATNDPGWTLGLSDEALKPLNYEKIQRKLRYAIGLEPRILKTGLNNLSEGCIRRFMRGYPERRRIGLYIREGYNIDQLTQVAQRLMIVNEDTEDYSIECSMLPGGIHFYNEQKNPPSTRLSSIGEKVFLYNFEEERKDELIKSQSPDIEVLANNQALRVKNHDGGVKADLCRGKNHEVVYAAMPASLDEGEDHWTSKMFVTDGEVVGVDQDNIGNLFKLAAYLEGQITKNITLNKKNIIPRKPLDTPWLYLPSAIMDQAALVKFVEDRREVDSRTNSLWDYKHDVTKGNQESYYTLSRIPSGVDAEIRQYLGGKEGIGKELIYELAKSGIAIGGESLKTTNAAKGAVGLAAAARLFSGWQDKEKSLLENGPNKIGFMLPVDSFETILGKKVEADNSDKKKLCDLAVFQLTLPKDDNGELEICVICVEAKYRKLINPKDKDLISKWFSQATQTIDRIKELVRIGRKKDGSGIPERLGMNALLHFGVRLTHTRGQHWLDKEAVFLNAMLQGRYIIKEDSIALITTEASNENDAEYRERDGAWFRLNTNNWPGVNDTESLLNVRKKASGLLGKKRINAEEIDNLNKSTDDKTKNKIPDNTDGQEINSEPPTDKAENSSGSKIKLEPFLIGASQEGKSQVILDFDGSGGTQKLDNRNLLVTGSSGKGKTTFLKTLAVNIRKQGGHFLMLDFKTKDFCGDNAFVQKMDSKVAYCKEDGLPFNPLIPSRNIHPRTKEVYYDYKQHIASIVQVITEPLGVKTFQQVEVEQAITECFEQNGIDINERPKEIDLSKIPTISEIETILKSGSQRAKEAYVRMKHLFTFRTFPSDFSEVSIKDLVQGSWILDLSSFTEGMKNTIAQLVMVCATNHFGGETQTGLFRWGLVMDEAHRVKGLPEVEMIARECRAWGTSLILSSQFVDDFDSEVRGNLATIIAHGHDRNEEKVQELARAIAWKNDLEELYKLDIFQALVTNKHYENDIIFTLGWPHYLIYEHLIENGSTELDDLNKIIGLDPEKTNFESLLSHLKKMGLIEIVNDEIQLID